MTCRVPPLLFALGLLLTRSGSGQPRQQSPSDLVRFFAIESDGPVIFSCARAHAEDEKDRPVADALVKLGDSAIQNIETALDSIEERGRESAFAYNAGRLLQAYARVKGPSAFPRLQRMRRNPKLTFLAWGLDHSVALSLGLTSYLSSSSVLAEKVCTSVLEPRDLLDQLILAWERNDRQWTERSLGPRSRAALNSLLKGRTWDGMRAELWRGKSGDGVAVGYRFEASGWWSASEEPLEIRLDERNPVNPEIDTIFTNSAGLECGKHRIEFLKMSEGYKPTYPVDNSDMGELLRMIASCAAE